MKLETCKICNQKEDIEYTHMITYDRSKKYATICENCRDRIFFDKQKAMDELVKLGQDLKMGYE